MSSFSWEIQEEAGALRYTLTGAITEKVDFSALLGQSAPRVIIDLGGIERINSGGVGGWVAFISRLSAPPREVVLERCSTAIVRQINMISTMRGRAKIRSVMVPYLCINCEQEHHSPLDLERSNPRAVPATMPCPSCGGQMEFDDLPEVYFAFYQDR